MKTIAISEKWLRRWMFATNRLFLELCLKKERNQNVFFYLDFLHSLKKTSWLSCHSPSGLTFLSAVNQLLICLAADRNATTRRTTAVFRSDGKLCFASGPQYRPCRQTPDLNSFDSYRRNGSKLGLTVTIRLHPTFVHQISKPSGTNNQGQSHITHYHGSLFPGRHRLEEICMCVHAHTPRMY